jgi:hypothetical protein
MTYYIVSDDGDSRPTRECMICLICVIFPPLLLIGGIYYLCKKEYRLMGSLMLLMFIITSTASVFIIRLFLMKCGSCIGAFYCPTNYQDKTTLCAACPSDANIEVCNMIASSKTNADDYQYILEQCMRSCTTDQYCTNIYNVVPGWFCNIINYDAGVIMACPSNKSMCEHILLNISWPNLCEQDCFSS